MMGLLDILKSPEVWAHIGSGLQRVGSVGGGDYQGEDLARFYALKNRREQEKRYRGLLEDMSSPVRPEGGLLDMGGGVSAQPITHGEPDLNERQRGILSVLPPEQGMGLLAQQAFAAPPKPTSLMQNAESIGLRPGTKEYADFVRNVMLKPQVQIQNAPKLPPGYMARNPKDLSEGVVPIPDGPADPTSPSRKRSKEEAATISAAKNSKQEIEEVRKSLFSADGSLNRRELLQSSLPWTSGRTTRQRVKRAIESVIRAQSGAAVPDTELERYMDMFYPKVADNNEAAKAKMEALERFVSGLLSGLGAGGDQQYSQEDLEYTARKYGISVEEVKRRLQNAP